MAREKRRYRKLSKTGGLFAYYSFWQGPDHLLSAETAMAGEDYRRFYYRDIQAIIIQKTGLHHVYSFLFGLPCILALIVGTLGDTMPHLWLIFSALTGLMLAINLYRGSTCVCHIRTAVQNVKIKALVRMRRMNRVLDQIAPLIADAQGHLPPAPSTPPLPKDASVALHTAVTTKAVPTSPATDNSASSGIYRALFGGLVIQALVTGIDFYARNIFFGLSASLLALGVMILTFVALARQVDSDLPPATKRFTWAGLAFVCLQIVSGYAVSLWVCTRHPELMTDQWALFKHLAMLSPHDHPALMGLNLFTLGATLTLGLGGLVSLRPRRIAVTERPDRVPFQQAAA
ncbi:MAG: hypothetical protein JJV98_14085 [Desulfosarcina sp.]|nr:hypothetical protein [Desulfobacterales bacterium]